MRTVRGRLCSGQSLLSTETVRRARLSSTVRETSSERGREAMGQRESRLRTFETAFVQTIRTPTYAGGEKHPTVLVQYVEY